MRLKLFASACIKRSVQTRSLTEGYPGSTRVWLVGVNISACCMLRSKSEGSAGPLSVPSDGRYGPRHQVTPKSGKQQKERIMPRAPLEPRAFFSRGVVFDGAVCLLACFSSLRVLGRWRRPCLMSLVHVLACAPGMAPGPPRALVMSGLHVWRLLPAGLWPAGAHLACFK